LHLLLFDIIDTVRSLGWGGAFELLRNGIVLGSLYALIALGYSMVYGILKLLNFAHGDIYMVGAYIGYGIITVFGGPTALTVNVALMLFLMFFCATLGGGLMGVMIERFAYRRLRNAPRIAPLITALGVSFFLENGAQLVLGAQFQSYNSFGWTNNAIALNGFTLPAGVRVSIAQIIVVVGAVVLMILLTAFVQRTQTGKAMRATSYDREAAAMMGIDVDRVIVVTFFIGSALAGAAGVMVGLVFQRVYHFMGFVAGLKGFTAAVVGGIGSIPGAMLGGLVIGLAEAFSTGYLSSTFQDLIVFGILIVVLIVRPTGLLGKADIKKV
jgi:branched-chain amino acid transport system permease protein